MTGQLVGTASDRPVEVRFQKKKIEFRFDGFRSAWRNRKIDVASIATMIKLLRKGAFSVDVVVGNFRLELLPIPSRAIRYFSPGLYRVLIKDRS